MIQNQFQSLKCKQALSLLLLPLHAGRHPHFQGEVPAPPPPRPPGSGPGQRQAAVQTHVLRDGAAAQRRRRDFPRRAQVTLRRRQTII